MTAPVSLKEYFALASSRFTAQDAQTIGSQMEVMAESGAIDERAVVDVARSPNSPLNRYFEWDDAVAGDRYRLIQAGEMMRSIRVRTMDNGRARVMPVYKLVTKPASPKPAPKAYNALHPGSAFAAKVTTQAYDDLMAWKSRYGVYLDVWSEFATVFREVANQISEFEDVGRPAGIDRETDDAIAGLIAWRERFGAMAPRWEELREQLNYTLQAIQQISRAAAFVGDASHEVAPS